MNAVLAGSNDYDDEVNKDISWSAYFARMQESLLKPPVIVALLPLFRDNAHSAAMVKHGMDIIKQITNHVNAGQTPVLTVDQPLYAKKIQWAWLDVYEERQFVVMMVFILNVVGDFLDGSGWVSVMTSANGTAEGRAFGLQKGSHTSRGQWAHQAGFRCLVQHTAPEHPQFHN